MKQHDERIYRKSGGRPTLQTLRSQLARCREDYERFAGKETTVDLRIALRAKIAALELEIAQATKAAATQTNRPTDPGSDDDANPRSYTGPHRAAATRLIPPRFRAR
ncbi:MAG: hypothetical protein GC191_18825 [Azospirillum sp.]|nr:hypothetical protein [Azospirillum sp.]